MDLNTVFENLTYMVITISLCGSFCYLAYLDSKKESNSSKYPESNLRWETKDRPSKSDH